MIKEILSHLIKVKTGILKNENENEETEKIKKKTGRFNRLMSVLNKMAKEKNPEIRKWANQVINSQELENLSKESEDEKIKMNKFVALIQKKIENFKEAFHQQSLNPQINLGELLKLFFLNEILNLFMSFKKIKKRFTTNHGR